MKSTTCRTDLGANTAREDEEKKVLTSADYEQADDGIPVVQMDCAFLHDTGDKAAKVTFLTMVENSFWSKWLQRQSRRRDTTSLLSAILLKGLESFGVASERWCFRQTKKRGWSMWQNTWQLREKRQPSSDRLPRRAANQTRTLNEHTRVLKPWSEP